MIFAVVCFFSSQKESKAQDPAFSQFYANPLYLNPAFSGSAPKGAPEATLIIEINGQVLVELMSQQQFHTTNM